MSTTINVFRLTGNIPCEVKATLRPGFVIVDYEGEKVFAELQTTEDGLKRWEFWAGSPSAEDKAALTAAIDADGGFDETTVVVTPPSVRPPS